jgi:nucleoid-associated protein YgaU
MTPEGQGLKLDRNALFWSGSRSFRDDKRRKLPKSVAFKVWKTMAISRLGRTAVAVSGLTALAAIVIWIGILNRESGPGSAPRQAGAPAPAGPPGDAGPGTAEPDPNRVARAVEPPPSSPPATPSTAPAPPPSPAVPVEASPARPAPIAPSFDIVRVEPSGESVIAGRTVPGATVELLRNGKSHARIASDASGLFAFVPPPFPPGSHEIVLQSIAPDGTRTQSKESVTIAIAEMKDAKPLVALTTPDRPTVVLSEPGPAAPTAHPEAKKTAPPQTRTAAVPEPERPEAAKPSGAGAPPPAAPSGVPAPSVSISPPTAPAPPPSGLPRPRPQVRIASVEAEEGGRLFVSGEAAPGATVRLYLNETIIAPGGAGTDGRVSFAIGRGVKPGAYRVRLDDVDPVSGEVKSRAEVEFRVPAPVTVELPPAAQPYVTGAPSKPPSAGRVASVPAAPTTSPPSPGATSAPTPAGPGSPAPAQATPAQRPTISQPPAGGLAPSPSAPTVDVRTSETSAPAPSREAAPPPARTAAAGAGSTTGTTALPAATAAAVQRQLDSNTVLIPKVNTAIVSRGDNLWRISRRVYGRGVRYTVIYSANEEQIRNPHLIYPGQVFVLPAETADEIRR